MSDVTHRPLRFAITGLGDWAWRHVGLIRSTPGLELCGVCSRSAAAAERAARDLPGVPFFTNQAALLGSLRPDVVVITTPHHTHAAFSVEALCAGAHVVVEKPLATSASEGRLMLEAARRADRSLIVYHNRHWDPWLQAARSVLASGRLGRLVRADLSWPYHFPVSNWRGRLRESGGQFLDVGAHLVEWLLQFAGEAPAQVSAFSHRCSGTAAEANDDHIEANFRFANGLFARVACSGLDAAPARRFHLVGEKATYTDDWNWGGGSGTLWTGRPFSPITSEAVPYGAQDESGNGRPIYENLCAHLRTGAPLAVSPERALLVLSLLETAAQSAAREGAWLPVPSPA